MESRQKILIVDDKRENLVALRKVLAEVDAEIVEAASGNEALAATLDRHFGVAILDVMMPGMGGYELARHLRGDDKTKGLPILFVTASHADGRHLFDGYEAGGVDYIVKPFDPHVLLGKVRMFLEIDRSREELRRHRDHMESLVVERTDALKERVKEIHCLYAVSKLAAEPCASLDQALQAAVDLIPPGLQYPEIACARITFEGREFKTANFRDTPWKLRADLPVPVSVLIGYLEEKPERDEGPFLMEKRHLVDDIARQLGVMIKHKRAEHDLVASETRYRRLFESAKDGILILDADTGRIVDVNPFLLALTGYSREQYLGKHLWEIGPFKNIQASRDSFAELQAKGYVRYEDLPLETRDGRKIDVEFVSNTYRADNQKVIQCNIRDVTERKRGEADLRWKSALLEAQANATIDGILVVDGQGKKLFQNRRCVELWKIPAPIVANDDDRQQLEFVKDRTKDPEKFVERAVHLYSHPDETSRDEVEFKDGMVLDRYSAPVIGPEGTRFGRIWVFRDITKRKRAEAERARLEEQFRQAQKMEAVGHLAGGIAHDFNNLLTVINGYGQLILSRMAPDDLLRPQLEEMMQAGERAASLTRQLLAFGRRQPTQPRALHLNYILLDMEKMLRRLIPESVALETDLAPTHPSVHADPGQIEQVVMNLVVNARDAMTGGGTLTLATAAIEVDRAETRWGGDVVPGPYVRLSVSDTGCGMSEEVQRRIFEPFFTTKEPGKGTGLGLATVYGIVRQSGGFIEVESAPGRGTTFRIHLPRAAGEAVAAERPPATKSVPRGRETILLVEDVDGVRDLLAELLGSLGYAVVTAAGGAEALKRAEGAGPIDLLLTDVVMPGMGGSELAKRMAALRPGTKTLFMSGYADNAIDPETANASADCLQKPVTIEDLARKVREVLDRGR